jgi:Ca2+-binding EF-hand superfamily protein
MRVFALFIPLLIVTPGHAQPSDVTLISRIRGADANRDGTITKPELIAYRAANFGRIDRNNDGYLTDSDIPAFLRGRGGPIDLESLRSQFDANRDGKISRDEFATGPTLVFDRADADRNCQLTTAEINRAIASAQMR